MLTPQQMTPRAYHVAGVDYAGTVWLAGGIGRSSGNDFQVLNTEGFSFCEWARGCEPACGCDRGGVCSLRQLYVTHELLFMGISLQCLIITVTPLILVHLPLLTDADTDTFVGSFPPPATGIAAGVTFEKAAYATVNGPGVVFPYVIAFGGTDSHDRTTALLAQFTFRTCCGRLCNSWMACPCLARGVSFVCWLPCWAVM
jgi:hypothetical protein